jgi:4-amino-4-deoxy-L-arabinose transferase-like glycosyltransferase
VASADQTTQSSEFRQNSAFLWTLFVVLAAAALSYLRLTTPLQEPQEVRYAEIPRQMLTHQSWLIPILHGQPYLDKPPLLYWLVMACYTVFGTHDWAARLVPSTAVFLTIMTTYFWAGRIMRQPAAVLSALSLCLCVRYVYLARLLTMDTLLCLFVISSLAFAHLALRGSRLLWRPWLLSSVGVGLGLLTKGPVAAVLVIVPIAASGLLGQIRWPSSRAWLAFGGVMLGVAAPWYIAMLVVEPEFADYFFVRHHLARFATPFDHQEPFWFYVPELLVGILPGAIPIAGIGFAAWRKGIRGGWSAELGFFLLACAWCVGFFSVAGCKRPGYILPAMPLLALAAAKYVDALWLAQGSWRSSASWLLGGAVCVVLVGGAFFMILPKHAGRFSMRGQVQPLARCVDSLPVVCYPRRWDSVSYYLERDDVRAYMPAEREQFLHDLHEAPRTLIFIKSQQAVAELLRDLPQGFKFVPQGEQGTVRVGFLECNRQRERGATAERIISEGAQRAVSR